MRKGHSVTLDSSSSLPAYAVASSAGRLMGLRATRERAEAVAEWKSAGCPGLVLVVSGGPTRGIRRPSRTPERLNRPAKYPTDWNTR